MKQIQLVIFDMDGLMIDSETVYIRCAKEVLKEMGVASSDFLPETLGINWVKSREVTLKHCPDLDYDDYMDRLRVYQDAYLKEHPYQIKKGLIELLDYLEEEKILKAVATSTDRDRAILRLKNTGIFGRFDYLICGNDLSESKPSPQIYLKVLERFGVSNENAMVFEDSYYGLLSACNAKIRCVVVPDICFIPEDTLKKAYAVVPDLEKGISIIDGLNHQ
jgi:HAD superfamily hydrolase (TIGR01509 family)